MRTGLQTKFFLVFTAISIAVLVCTIAVSHVIAFLDFELVIKQAVKKQIDGLVLALEKEYQLYQGWNHIRDNPHHLKSLIPPPLIRTIFEDDPFLMPPPPLVPAPPPLIPFPAFSHFRDNQERLSSSDENPTEGRRLEDKRTELPRFPNPFDLSSRVTLFDAENRHVFGEASPDESVVVKTIIVDGKTVGLLDVKKPDINHLVVFMQLVSSQAKTLSIVSVLILIVIVIAAFLLSRHLLAPVKQLAEGAQAFASRKFDTRIETSSSDELGQLALHFNTMAQSLERYEKMRKQWLLDISHELRTPLSILQGEIEAMQDGVRDTNQEMLDSVHSEVLHISRIVNDLNELSLFESGGIRLKKEPVFILKELRERLSLFRKSFAQNNISITDKLGDDEMLTVSGDKDRLAQLFANLLDNSLRHTDAPGSLLVSKTNTDTHVSLYFEDSAPGVPNKSLDHLFDRLYRVDPSRDRSKGGSGLGLAIAKNIVESHGGEISAANSSLGGLKIKTVLPLRYNPL